jgi:hypothetical protein
MAKGGTYENTIIRKLTTAFARLGIHEDDCYRTRNSGASIKQPGDIQLSPKFGKLFKVIIECKHYKRIKYQLGKPLDHQDKSFLLLKWWKQVSKEQKQANKKFKDKARTAILIFRQNRCPDIVCLKLDDFKKLVLGDLDRFYYSWFIFTKWKKEDIVLVLLDEWLVQVILACQARKRNKIKADRIIGRGK